MVIRRPLVSCAALAIAVFWLFGSVTDGSAQTTCTVTDLADSGAGTLRDHIATPGCDVIDFSPGLLPGTITLTSFPLDVFRSVTIDGPGADQLTISGDNNFNVFVITEGDVTISGVTITTSNGAGINNATGGGSLTVRNSTISDNAGFGITASPVGTLTVENSTLFGNSGGGIEARRTVTVQSSTISGNSRPLCGGGIFIVFGDVVVRDSAISGNSADSGGGGICNTSGDFTLTVQDSTISGNSARFGDGGGILIVDGTVTVQNSTISGNHAGDGGGIFSFGGATVTVQNSTISGNSVATQGAASSILSAAP